MIARLSIAVAGAIIITVALLLGMRTFTTLFRDDTGERYFRITDILPKPPPGRPERPQDLSRPPQRVEPGVENPSATLSIQAPAAPAAPGADRPGLEEPTIRPPE
jgi:hypothetical protein